jgi:hypothetical protein
MKDYARCSRIAMIIVGLTTICVIPTLRGGGDGKAVAISRVGGKDALRPGMYLQVKFIPS